MYNGINERDIKTTGNHSDTVRKIKNTQPYMFKWSKSSQINRKRATALNKLSTIILKTKQAKVQILKTKK